ncbi:ubiquitin carboxyl-terminal hydrolase 2-like [Xenentodon cancila]
MTKDFREAVQRLAGDSCSEYIDGYLKDLFDDLLKQTGDASRIINALGIDREDEQQDAAQYFERILMRTSPEAAKIFQGQLAHRTVCGTCREVTDVDGPFWHLPLQLVDIPSEGYSVVDGIRKFFQTTDFSGDNQMFCDKCDDKVDATSQYVIKHHPDVLILLLKRFDFSYSCMSYVKINCAVDFPNSVKIPENEVYELYAVVDHFGDLRSGHYTAVIKSQDEEDAYYVFNDAVVTRRNYDPFQGNETAKSQNAYLLIYKKKDIATHDIMEVSTYEGSPPATIENCNQIHDAEMSTDRNEGADTSEGEMSVDPESSAADVSAARRGRLQQPLLQRPAAPQTPGDAPLAELGGRQTQQLAGELAHR